MQLHSPLHAAGAYLNPSIFYTVGSKIQKDPAVMRGVMLCIERMYPSQEIQDQINLQRDMYTESSGMFGFSSTQHLRDKKVPCKIQLRKSLDFISLFLFSSLTLQNL